MEIKVYTDASKIKQRYIGRLTLRQMVVLIALGASVVFMTANSFLWHFPNNIVQPIVAISLMVILTFMLFKMHGLSFDRWIVLRTKFYFSQKTRIYHTERVKKLNKNEYKTPKNFSEAQQR